MGKIFGNQYFYKKRSLSIEFLYKFIFLLTEKKICATMRMFIIYKVKYGKISTQCKATRNQSNGITNYER